MEEATYTEQAKAILAEMLTRLGVQADIECSAPEEPPRLSLSSEEAGRLIGRKGQTLESLELLMNRILKKDMGPESSTLWVALDVDGYRVEPPQHETRASHGRLPSDEVERLREMARDIAKEVRMLGQERVIGPFSPAERRVIHLALEPDPDIETVSDPVADQNRGKRITIRLK